MARHIGILLEPAHGICVPLFTVRHIHPHGMTLADEFPAQFLRDAEEHLKLVILPLDLAGMDQVKRTLDDHGIVGGDADIGF